MTIEVYRHPTDIPIELVIDKLPILGAGVEREIAAIAQEALTNAVRHARARKITVHAASSRSLGLRLTVTDDGRGIARERFGSGFGLTSMRERAQRLPGACAVTSEPGSGTTVEVTW